MYEWILPSLSEILAASQSSVAECSPAKAEQQWRVSLAATEHLLLDTLATASPDATQGLVLAAPAPLFSHPKLTQSLQTVTFTAKPFNPLALMPFQMPVAMATIDEIAPQESVLPLLPADPLASEQFCLVFTEKFRLVLVLAEHKNGKKTFSFSFEPEVVQQAWRALGARVILANSEFFGDLDALVQQYSPVAPDYHTVIQFSQLLLQQLPEPEPDAGNLPPCSSAPLPSVLPFPSRCRIAPSLCSRSPHPLNNDSHHDSTAAEAARFARKRDQSLRNYRSRVY